MGLQGRSLRSQILLAIPQRFSAQNQLFQKKRYLNNFEMVHNLNMTFNKVDFIVAFAISFSDRTLQLRSLSRLVCGE